MKKFIIIGNGNAVTYKEIFPYVKGDKLWWGASITSGDRKFYVPDNYPLEAAGCGIDEDGRRFIRVKGVRWWTNLTNAKRNTPLDLYKRYSNEYKEYPKYDNYDAININKTSDIPMDYDGVMGVPITFFDKYCPEQFEIVGCYEPAIEIELYKKASYFKNIPSRQIIHNGKLCQKTYHRLFIRKKKMKKFIIIGSMNAITYKEIFPYFKDNKMWLGGSGIKDMAFKVPSYYEERSTRSWVDENGQHWRSLGNGCWFTNVEHKKRHIPIDLYKRYSNEYKHYDNYDAIECGKVAEIPMDYNGVIGVPITFLDKYCPEQFEIVDINPHFFSIVEKGFEKPKQLSLKSYGLKDPYARILIRKRNA